MKHIVLKVRTVMSASFLKKAVLAVITLLLIGGIFEFQYQHLQSALLVQSTLAAKKSLVEKELETLKNQDQYKRNEALQEEIKNINKTYKDAIGSYEKIQDLKAQKQDTQKLDSLYAEILSNLAEKNYASASTALTDLNTEIEKMTPIASSAPSNSSQDSASVQVSNSAPANGYSRQNVQTGSGTFMVSIISADLNSTRVIVDTASDSDCANDCPVFPVASYAARSGAFAAINGNFFCPTEYPTCAGKTNTFDTLVMNKNKHYFNSDNNKYSTVPLAFFRGNTMGIGSQSLNWGRDTGVDAVIANFPLYVEGGQNRYGGSGDPKINNKGTRTFVANKGSMVYIGVIYNASAGDAADVLMTLKMDNALGLDQGGSTALWYNGSYVAGPGRNVPNALLFIHK